MPLAIGLRLVGLFLGAGALGIALILEARVLAFLQDGTFRALVPLILGTLGSLFIGTIVARSLSRPEASPKRAQPPHPSILADVATEAAHSHAPNGRSWMVSLTAPLLAILPLGVVLLATHSKSSPFRASTLLFLAATSIAALLFFVAAGVGGRGSPPSPRLTHLFWLIPLLGLVGGIYAASRASSELIGINELATTVVLLAGVVTLIGVFQLSLDRWQGPLVVAVVMFIVGRGASHIYASFDDIYERLTNLEQPQDDERFAHVIENGHGVVTLTTSGWLHENGRVQGLFNTNPVPAADRNRCSRAYVIPSALPDPQDILFLGLENASFAQILAHYPSVQRVVILEENPAYEQAVRNSGVVASLLGNDRVNVVYGEVRSTLKAQGKFDVIIMDRLPSRHDGASLYHTTEFLSSLASQLKPRGAVYVNTLEKPEVERALIETFPHLLRYQDMIFGSQERLRVDGYKWMRDLMAWKIDGQPVLPTKGDPTEIARKIVKSRDFRGRFAWEREDEIKERTKGTKPLQAASIKTGPWHFDTLP